MPSCYKCEAAIVFDSDYISEKTGKKIPLDEYSMEPHRCPMYNPPIHYKPCRKCQEPIYFDKDAPKSLNDKWIPQDKHTNMAHQCG